LTILEIFWLTNKLAWYQGDARRKWSSEEEEEKKFKDADRNRINCT